MHCNPYYGTTRVVATGMVNHLGGESMQNNDEINRKAKEELLQRLSDAELDKVEEFLNELEELIKKYSKNNSEIAMK